MNIMHTWVSLERFDHNLILASAIEARKTGVPFEHTLARAHGVLAESIINMSVIPFWNHILFSFRGLFCRSDTVSRTASDVLPSARAVVHRVSLPKEEARAESDIFSATNSTRDILKVTIRSL
jgi:hypothetical protein